jgi:hypothetical protein
MPACVHGTYVQSALVTPCHRILCCGTTFLRQYSVVCTHQLCTFKRGSVFARRAPISRRRRPPDKAEREYRT